MQIDRIRVDGLNLTVRRGAGVARKADSAPADVEIGGIELVNAEIGLKEPAGTTTLSKLDLKTGRIAPGAPVPITLSSNFALPSKASSVVTVKTTLALDPPRRAYGAEGVELTVRGRFDQDDIEAQTLSMPRLAGSVTIDDPALPGRSIKLPLTATLALDARKQALDVRADTRFDDTTLNAKIDVDNFSKPQIGFDLRADQFNLDRYSPPAAATPTATKAAATTPAATPTATSSAGNPDARVDLSVLRGLNARGQVSVGQLQARGSIKLAVTTAGANVNAMKHGLGGTMSIQLRDGAVRGINIAQKVRDARALIPGGGSDTHQADRAEKTDFSELNVSFNIQDGMASSNDLDLQSPLLRVGGSGRIDFGASAIDYIAREALKSKLTEDLKQRLPPQDKQKKIEERARDALKGLLGR